MAGRAAVCRETRTDHEVRSSSYGSCSSQADSLTGQLTMLDERFLRGQRYPARTRATASDQGPDLERLVAARAHADPADGCADHVLERPHVRLGVAGQVLELPGRGDVLPPAVQVLVNRHRMVELGL